jgi:hypothetical protein
MVDLYSSGVFCSLVSRRSYTVGVEGWPVLNFIFCTLFDNFVCYKPFRMSYKAVVDGIYN